METNLPEIITVDGTTYRRESADDLIAQSETYTKALNLIQAIREISHRTGCTPQQAAWAIRVKQFGWITPYQAPYPGDLDERNTIPAALLDLLTERLKPVLSRHTQSS